MGLVFLVFLVVGTLVLGACARPAPPEKSAAEDGVFEADAMKVVQRYDEAWAKKDLAAIGRILAPQYVYFSSRGGVSDLAQTRAMLSSPDYRLERGRRDALQPHRFGSTVVVGSHWTGAGVFQGQPFTDDQRCSIVVGFADGTGRVLSEHCTNLAAP